MRYIRICLDQSLNVKTKEIEQLKTVAKNKNQVVVDQPYVGFVILDTVKVKKGNTQFNPLVEDIAISDYSRDNYFRKAWGHLVIRIFTESLSDKILSNKINREVNKFIKKKQEEYSWYSGTTKCEINL